jgi:hypothetical protein
LKVHRNEVKADVADALLVLLKRITPISPTSKQKIAALKKEAEVWRKLAPHRDKRASVVTG